MRSITITTILAIQSVTMTMDMQGSNEVVPFGKRDKGYRCGRPVYLWADKWTFSYHAPDGKDYTHYTDTLTTFPSEEDARDAMVTFVWGCNQ